MAKTIGVSVNDREQRQIVDRFDEALDCGPEGSRSRSDQIKVAMAMWSQVAPYLEDAGYDISDRREVGGVVRQAVLDAFDAAGASPDT